MILHKSPREIYRTMSIHEAQLVLRTHARQAAASLLGHTVGTYLAGAAKWSDEAFAAFKTFCDEKRAIVDATPPRVATKSDLRGLFSALGIPAAK